MVKIKCRLLIFSGRPDPEWKLTTAQAAIFTKVFDALNQKGKWQEPSGRLGYHGCVLEADGKEWFVFNGQVSLQSNSEISYQDPSRSIEKFILQSAPSKWFSLISGILETQFN